MVLYGEYICLTVLTKIDILKSFGSYGINIADLHLVCQHIKKCVLIRHTFCKYLVEIQPFKHKNA